MKLKIFAAAAIVALSAGGAWAQTLTCTTGFPTEGAATGSELFPLNISRKIGTGGAATSADRCQDLYALYETGPCTRLAGGTVQTSTTNTYRRFVDNIWGDSYEQTECTHPVTSD
jgi:hypothetical protein